MEKRPLGIYVHIPFCAKKCNYCDFASWPGTADEQSYYMRVLMKEVRGFEALANLYRVETAFFGGGTPSVLDAGQIERVLSQLREMYEWSPDAEVSLECNPGTLTPEKARRYIDMGINRLSLGLQSVHEDELRLLGRIHSFEEFKKSYEIAREAGFTNINIDLMSALPHQTLDKWKKTLEEVVALEPEHISAYSLTIEPGTPFYEEYATPEGQQALPSEKLDREMYRYTKDYLEKNGYHRYEISNYAKEGRECRHNKVYWTGGEYVGFGVSAASYLDGRRFANPKDKKDYWNFARNAYAAFKSSPMLSEKERMEEYMFLGLRMDAGVSREEFERRFRQPFPQAYETAVAQLTENGLLEVKRGRIVLTDRGVDVSNYVLAEFIF